MGLQVEHLDCPKSEMAFLSDKSASRSFSSPSLKERPYPKAINKVKATARNSLRRASITVKSSWRGAETAGKAWSRSIGTEVEAGKTCQVLKGM